MTGVVTSGQYLAILFGSYYVFDWGQSVLQESVLICRFEPSKFQIPLVIYILLDMKAEAIINPLLFSLLWRGQALRLAEYLRRPGKEYAEKFVYYVTVANAPTGSKLRLDAVKKSDETAQEHSTWRLDSTTSRYRWRNGD